MRLQLLKIFQSQSYLPGTNAGVDQVGEGMDCGGDVAKLFELGERQVKLLVLCHLFQVLIDGVQLAFALFLGDFGERAGRGSRLCR